ncbi:alcohol dehydrogenase catalytic domain-containing protein [Arthrobacter sp. SD76]|uniref:alcohol dehydrogenase catalytic domain-containing protein n=1 Tax=Arthrobacter sp. SD76 TaxID=3415007 RepID=UPI003C77C64D
MRAWWVDRPGPVTNHPLVLGDRSSPAPGADEIAVQVNVCGICRTDLHLAEGDLAPRHPHVVPGHEAVGFVVEAAANSAYRTGDRVGVAWLGGVCGECAYCLRGDENLCSTPVFTGWDKDGGYAEQLAVSQSFAYPIPPVFTDEQAAPLLCSGIIGYRALKRASVPPGGRLGIYGFGSSAHLTAQLAMFQGTRVYVMTRSQEARSLARDLGRSSWAMPMMSRQSLLTPRSCLPLWVTWCRWHSAPWTVEEPSLSRASTSAPYPLWITRPNSFMNGKSAA